MKLCKLMPLLLISLLVMSACSVPLESLAPEMPAAPAQETAVSAPAATVSGELQEEQVQNAAVSADSVSEDAVRDMDIAWIPLEYSEQHYEICDVSENVLSKGMYGELNVADMTHVSLNAALNRENTRIKEQVVTETDRNAELAMDAVTDGWGDENTLPFYSECSLEAVRADDVVVSVMEGDDSFAGGPHPNYYIRSFNIAPETGERLTIEDVVTDTDEFATAVETELLKTVDKEELLTDSIKDTVLGMISDPEKNGELTFILRYNYMEVIFSPYDILPHSEGIQIALLKYDDYPGLFSEELKAVPETYMETAVDGMECYSVSGQPLGRLTITGDYGEDGYIDELTVSINGMGRTRAVRCRSTQAWLAHIRDKLYLLVDEYADGDKRVIEVYDLSSGEARFKSRFAAGIDKGAMPLNPERLRLVQQSSLLSSYEVYRDHSLNEDGEFEAEEDYAYLRSDSGLSITPKKPIEVKMLDNDDGTKSHDATIGSGIELFFYRTDLDRSVDFKLVDGKVVRITVDSDDPSFINGEPLEDIFYETHF